MRIRIAVPVALAVSTSAAAKPAKLVTTKIDKVTLGVPKGYKAAVAEKCIAYDGGGSLYVIRTSTSREDFEKKEGEAKDAKKVAKDKVLCFERSKPGENARCLVTTDAGNWVTQFVSFGKKYSALGGAATMQAIVESIKDWDGTPYDGTYSLGNDCPVVK